MEDSAPGPTRTWLSGANLGRAWQAFYGLGAPAALMCISMLRVRSFTIDDAYISFRYARNLANGLGLVYNEGERIEGYTNFLWTVLLAVGYRCGADVVMLAKVMGAASALGTMWFMYLLAEQMRRFTNLPCIATWLLASTVVFTGYSVFGLETPLFALLVVAGLYRMRVEEVNVHKPFPWSGILFGLAGLTRPEAPLFIGIATLYSANKWFGKMNLMRWAFFVGIVGTHLLWRHSYYGAWVPNTLAAKTGHLENQMHAGVNYLGNYARMGGFLLALAPLAVGYGIWVRSRLILCVATITALMSVYVILVGGDWMPYFRFVAPVEPFAFLLVDVVFRAAFDRRGAGPQIFALAGFGMLFQTRLNELGNAQSVVHKEHEKFWTTAAGGTAKYFMTNTKPGTIAMGDIGEIGWKTNYPVLDLLGLVDPIIAKLPGGYTQKLGPGFTDRFYSVKPRYALIISAENDCAHPSVSGSIVLYNSPRFLQEYNLHGRVPLNGGFAWCIYERRDAPK